MRATKGAALEYRLGVALEYLKASFTLQCFLSVHLSLISDQYSGVKTLVRRLLCSARPVVIQTPVNPTASDQDLQQTQLWQLCKRTTTLPFGRGAFTLATTCTLLTEDLTIPKLILAGWLPSQQNAMVNLDPNVRNVQELKSWPEFHNVVAVGLRLTPPQVALLYNSDIPWVKWNPPFTRQGSLQPKCAARVEVSDSDMPHGSRPA
ncbi:hypothetical protein CQW23_19671 [Capsicum baccatum]|uniref:Uncharacterized protein n=1 Tax=Capsicum baccatum TaxID=33114 RepID=A0A2G2W6G1_CAPBA|nr:hypothetical protein CQW23_19671 [Capsicum baccatum]